MVDQINMQSLLQQMQDIKSRSSAFREDGIAGQLEGVERPREEINFSSTLKSAIDSVNATQKEAGKLAKAFELGDPNVDITRVMIAIQKSSVSFQAMTQVRNKLVEAYKEVMNSSI
ncbi:MAG: flagellar hook-basal body complex protein FliE [Gammaproteobacteria bacterium]|nr:MAG: flagellar hook-basal body complex protein FliE [Gammaproteobacteria bacterium]